MAFLTNIKSSMQNPAYAGKKASVDSSQIDKLKQMGYDTNYVSSDPAVLSATTPTTMEVMPGVGVSGYTDIAGNFYVVDETNKVSVVTPSKVQGQNIVGGGGQVVGGGGQLPFVPDGPVVPPVVPPSNPNQPFTPPPPPNLGSGRIYTKFEPGDVVPNQQETVTRALWSNNVGILTTFYTSSVQTANQKRYYYEVYNSASDACGAAPQFSVAWGHKYGSGSADEGGQINDTPSRAIYGQYRLLCLNGSDEFFTIGGNSTDNIYVVNVNRARMREYLDEGNLEINLAALSGSEFVAGGGNANAHTGSNVRLAGNGKVIRLVDDSRINAATITDSGEVYNIVSGSIEDGVYNSSAPHIYGQLYRRLGIVVLDGNILNMSCSFATVSGSEISGDNAYKLFTSMSGSALYTDASGDQLGFAGRSAEKVKSTHFFCRIRNGEYNFSNNPSFATGSGGDIAQPTFIGNPRVYITTVGLFNERRECVAVAKLSKPLQKSFTRELLLKVKLDF